MREPCSRRSAATWTWLGALSTERSCARAAACFCWSSVGRCFSAAPATAPLERVSIAFSIAAISSARSFCRASKSEDFFSQVAVRSERYFLSSSRVAVVCSRSLLASPAASRALPLASVFRARLGGGAQVSLEVLLEQLEGL